MKIKKLTLVLVVLTGLSFLLIATALRAPNSSQKMATVCQINPIQCVIPENLSKFPLRPW